MCATLLILATGDGDLWMIWLVTVIIFFITLPFYIYSKSKKKNQYEINELETISKAYKEERNYQEN
jgi:hypothetical protein